MLCAKCSSYNPPGSKYCGSCGYRVPAFSPAATATEVLNPLLSAHQTWVSDEAPAPPTVSAGPDHRPRLNGSQSATTRYLCAAVTLDPSLERRVLDDVLEEQNRAVVTTPGVDLVTVLKYALAAHRRRVVRDAFLLADLCALIVMFILFHSLLVFLPVLVVAWAAVLIERYISKYGSVISGLRPGAFAPRKAPSPNRDSFADRQLRRVAVASTVGNVSLYSEFPPFVGYGRVAKSWSFAIDVTRPRREAVARRFSVLQIYDYIKAGLYELDLPGIEVSDRLFVDGRDIQDDPRFLPKPGISPVTSVSPHLIRDLIAMPEERVRPYLTISMTGWQGDLVVTTFLRFLLSKTDLFVEGAHTFVPPIRDEFKAIDERNPAPTAGEFFSQVGKSLVDAIPRLLGSVPSIIHELGSDGRRERKRRHTEETGDYGALFSVREAAADRRWQRYFQVFDDARYVKVIEQRIFRSLLEFLENHGIDTSSLESRTETVINNGVMVTDKATVHAEQIAAGAGAQAAGLISRVRGKEGAGSSEG